MTSSDDGAAVSAVSTQTAHYLSSAAATELIDAMPYQQHDAAEPEAQPAEAKSPNAAPEHGHIVTAERVALLPWGEGSAPSLPSIDEGFSASDRDSVGSVRSSTMSVSSSIYHFVEENGRTYHRYKEGRYHLPNDEEEQERLDLQHAVFLVTSGGKMFLAPIGDNPQHVLDIATGTGIWAIEFAQLFPRAQVVGTDLSPIQPEYVPSNCTFEIDDAEDEWTFATKFDFIHWRALVSCFNDPAFVIKQAFNALAPGGYLEYQDGWFPMGYAGEPPVDSQLHKWNQLVMQSSRKMGRDWGCPPKYKGWFEEAGFEEVVERRFYWPSSQWAKGNYYKNVAAYAQEDMLRGVEAVSMKMFGTVGYTAEMTRKLLEDVRKDIKNTNIRAYIPIIFVWGRKPGGSPVDADPPPAEATV